MRWSERTLMTSRTSSSVQRANCARSDVSCAIFVPEGVTRCSNSRDAMSRCIGVERLDRPLEVIGHDLPCAAEFGERLGAEGRGAARAFDVPQPLHHELQIRRFDARRTAVSALRALTSRGRARSAPRRRRRARRPTSVVVDRHRLAFELAPALEWPHDRRAPRRRGRAARGGERSRTGSGSQPFSRSSEASVSSRSESSTFTRSGPSTSAASAVVEAVVSRRGR